ncbi:hypothetical protein RJ639_007224 [Escallonia herrerae]|uniref:Pentatricopeptide repeat-containing protein n=1 Tax=Escallonia herrerae TaxID=1293975 RepID=A0AA88VY79_9ASTE|nr:hypothetical protein RJ639_007224 [Escallonia herrerae]
MRCSVPSSSFLPSSLPHSSLQFFSPDRPFFSTNRSKTRECKLLLFAALPQSTPPNTLRVVKKNDKLRTRDVRHIVDIIQELPSTRTIKITDIVNRNNEIQTISHFNDLLMALVRASEIESALKLYSNLSSDFEFVPDSLTYSILVKCYCKKEDPTEAYRVLIEMVENGFQPNVATFTDLMNALCKKGRLQKAFEVIRVMGRVGCEPTINTYNCLLKGLCYVGRIEEAYEMLMKIKKSSKNPDIYTYTAVMDGFCKVGRSNEAMELLDEAEETGLIPNVVSFNTLFNGYFKEGRPLDGLGLLKQMKERNCAPDCISYSTLLHGLLKWGEITAALRIYREMVGSGFEADERLMNTLLRGLCRRSRKEKELLQDVYEVLETMKNGTYVICPVANDLVIESLCIGKEVDKALVHLRETVRIGYSPRTITFTNVIGALSVEGKLKEAMSAFSLMYEGSRMPNRIPFDILINAFNLQGITSSACNVYGAALKIGVVPQQKPRDYA